MRLLGDAVPGDAQVEGERGVAAVHRERSMRARVRSVAAASLMGILGLSALAWYYSGALGRTAQARAHAQKVAQGSARADAPLPPLGRVDPPPAPGAAVTREASLIAAAPAPAVSPPLTESAIAAIPAANGVPLLPYLGPGVPSGAGYPPSHASAPPKTAAELAFERRLAGRVFGHREETTPGPGPGPSPSGDGAARPAAFGPEPPSGPDAATGATAARETAATRDAPALLAPNGAAAAVQPRMLPTLRFLLPKGAFIDCTLEAAIDSSLPGVTTCVTATDTFGADGTVVLLERGTKLVGETRGQVLQGATRVGVIWTEARTPTGVVVPLDSPATDELGRSGLPGTVNRHFWERFGAAILITTLDGAVQAAVQSASRGSGTVLYNPGSSEAVGTEVLKGTLAIPPTVVKAQGDRVQAIVARDIDFRSVYELRLAAPR